MQNYTLYFSFFGKNLKTTVEADSYEQAEKQVKDRLVFHKQKTEVTPIINDDILGVFGAFFGKKK